MKRGGEDTVHTKLAQFQEHLQALFENGTAMHIEYCCIYIVYSITNSFAFVQCITSQKLNAMNLIFICLIDSILEDQAIVSILCKRSLD
jgi:hypothetical protein